MNHIADTSDWRINTTQKVQPINIIGLWEGEQISDIEMLGKEASGAQGAVIGTVVSVNISSGILIVRDGNAQHHMVQLSAVTLNEARSTPTTGVKLNKHGLCPVSGQVIK